MRLLRRGARLEGRELYQAIVRLGIASVFLLGASVFGILGVWALLAAMFEGLRASLGVPGALGVVGTVSFVFGGFLLWAAQNTAKK